ncbi:MAG: helicase-associated domain-containing protein, partial [Candidatus Nanopelagicaceae bacterium]
AELAYQIGILSIDADGRILPNANFDIFQTKNFEEQWRELVSSWQISSRVSGLVGRVDSRNVTALGSELDRANAARIRQIILGSLKPGISPTLDSITSAARWRYPHRRALTINTETVTWTVREAEWLGITGAGALSSFGKKFLAGEKRLGIDAALPAPVDHILIQGDNTAIAPGPLTVEISRHLSTFADIESRGGATVYRFSESSLRRGLDHGHTGEEIRTFLREISKTLVPQPLDYLISDVAKKHGRLRVGYANCYIRCDDETIIAAILKDKNLEHLRLRQIAPQVLVGDAESAEMMDELREAGYFPSGENGQGAVIQVPVAHRAKSRPKPPRIVGEISAPSDDILKVAIRTLRTGEKSAPKRTSGELPLSSSSETLDLLNDYLGKGVALRIGYADTNGAVSLRIIDPLSISLGTLIAKDHLTNGITPFKIARITGVTRA